MKKSHNYKQLILGIAIGAVATISISAIADYTYNVTPNPYPVKVNGHEQALEGYNINDNTYFKLRDIGDKVGFGVGFEDDTIMVNVVGGVPAPTPEPVVNPTPIPWSEVPPQATELNSVFPAFYDYKNGLTSDGIPILISKDSEKYISTLDIDKVYKYSDYGYGFGYSIKYEDFLALYDKKNNIVIDNIPMIKPYPTYEYYETVLRPFFIEQCK